MAGKTVKCECSRKRKIDPKKCSETRIRQCHGSSKAHPCEEARGRKNTWTGHQAEYWSLRAKMGQVAVKNGYAMNPDEERVEKVLGLMTENLVATGKPYCPCKQSDPLNLKKDVICPCPDWKKEIEKDGHCFCRLFYRKPAGVGTRRSRRTSTIQ